MNRKAIIITSRDYFTCKASHEKVLPDGLVRLLMKHLNVPQEEQVIYETAIASGEYTPDELNSTITTEYFNVAFKAAIDRTDLKKSIDSTTYTSILRIPVGDEYVIYLAPCLPRAVPGENFKDRQDYVASVVNMCIEDLGQEIAPESIYLLAHDNDMISDPVDRAIVEKDIIVDSKLKSLLSEKKIFIDNIYVFIHSLSTCKIYELLVNKLSNSDVIIPEMCLNAIEIIEGGRRNVDILQKFDECQHDVASFYNSLN